MMKKKNRLIILSSVFHQHCWRFTTLASISRNEGLNNGHLGDQSIANKHAGPFISERSRYGPRLSGTCIWTGCCMSVDRWTSYRTWSAKKVLIGVLFFLRCLWFFTYSTPHYNEPHSRRIATRLICFTPLTNPLLRTKGGYGFWYSL